MHLRVETPEGLASVETAGRPSICEAGQAPGAPPIPREGSPLGLAQRLAAPSSHFGRQREIPARPRRSGARRPKWRPSAAASSPVRPVFRPPPWGTLPALAPRRPVRMKDPARSRDLLIAVNATPSLSRAAVCRLGQELDRWTGRAARPDAERLAAELSIPRRQMEKALDAAAQPGDLARREAARAERHGARLLTALDAGYPD